MRRIEIDDDVYYWLEQRARGFQTPNDVLRRELLGVDVTDEARGSAIPQKPGVLYPLIQASLVNGGDELCCHRSRSGVTHRATVQADGWIKTDGGLHKEPSPALREYVGSQIDGWANWIHVPSGKRLRDLRAEARTRAQADKSRTPAV